MESFPELATNRFLAYYRQVQRIHLQDTGVPLREYKPTEPDRLKHTFDGLEASSTKGPDFLGETLHTLVWSQCLGNANHRTTILFLDGILTSYGIRFPHYAEEDDADNRFQVAIEQYSDASHRLLDKQSEFGYNPAQLKRRHRQLSTDWIKRQLGDQSRVATMIDPQRLMTFFSSGVKREPGP